MFWITTERRTRNSTEQQQRYAASRPKTGSGSGYDTWPSDRVRRWWRLRWRSARCDRCWWRPELAARRRWTPADRAPWTPSAARPPSRATQPPRPPGRRRATWSGTWRGTGRRRTISARRCPSSSWDLQSRRTRPSESRSSEGLAALNM